MTGFHGQRYLVTGAASGIGQAVAEILLAAGAEVVSLDRNYPSAAVSRHVNVDLADRGSIDTALAQLKGPFDGLMNIAGIPGTAPADQVFAVNTLAIRHLVECSLDLLNSLASVTVVSSAAGYRWQDRLPVIRDLLATRTFEEGAAWFRDHPPQGSAYTFSKEAITAYAMSMGLVLGASGLRINAVLPGPVQTPILTDFEKTMGKQNLDRAKVKVGRHARPEEIAHVVVFLASDAARWINGQSLIVDGGLLGAVLTGAGPAPQI
ncbi:3-alpha-hydroxysteroid dehydrogenase [Mycolicibacterium novocastrense]|uniref:coniferyl-alcohol dehydrogenase n=1 Tax=Mycolicibacterium novocastrense TaxID=59813 RepID=UPI0007491A9E|nr:coniferyl-alcohol dehydrogenase [Mycolicibacterium novocastrense]KUH69829.1 3-alpha-hydroxysteroid dehydrogenase [Mycolicibacterium novocastrense]KUH71378.1 3-alpha-hydroxysteroid dehydrogenase [Mycolicibacterium novocastrense]KUH74442.1 3-alpha-hydroxysteroid dehydrogenase [Mycolicibacterium novocastrense]